MPAKMTRLTQHRRLTEVFGAERLQVLVTDLADMWEVTEAEAMRRLSRALNDPLGSPRPWPAND